MDIILIAAITMDGFIAKKSDEVITWSKDLKLFKKQTMGYPVIMGSRTLKTLAVDLEGREKIIVHREDSPEDILSKLDTDKCFVIGGGMTNTKFSKYLTHLYLTPHPILFGKGIKLFSALKYDIQLELQNAVVANESEKIIQYQYKIIR
jgi:dihydrofolate reductase